MPPTTLQLPDDPQSAQEFQAQRQGGHIDCLNTPLVIRDQGEKRKEKSVLSMTRERDCIKKPRSLPNLTERKRKDETIEFRP